MSEALTNSQLKYTGKVQPHDEDKDEHWQSLSPYLPDDDLVEAVNLAIYLKRPLLIKGEPGCGKTRLARAVSYELNLPYEAWHITSTSRARDGRYTYDNIGRLRDAQLAGTHHLNTEELHQITTRVNDPAYYIHWGPLGRAFQNTQRTVLLIDEIDKADVDFPNDLLLELDEKRFDVLEINKTVKAHKGAEPIVFITSNDEKDLPDAFLRRCLFYRIEFPNHERLIDIVKIHFRDVEEDLVYKAVERFERLRKEMEKDKNMVRKKVSTSELLDWFYVLHQYPHDEALARIDGKLPASVLLKSWDDHVRYLRLTASEA